jgi:signal transduction histidine kinase
VQRLFGVGMALQGAAMMAGDGDRRVAAALSSAVDEVDAAISEIRAYVHDLRPAGLGEETVRRLIADDVSMLNAAGIETEVHLDDGTLKAISGVDVSAEMVQVLAEACANMARYAHARHAQIRLERSRGAAVLTVGDDGIGFNPAAHVTGHGLKNLRERAARLAGELHVESAPGMGARLRLEVPL